MAATTTNVLSVYTKIRCRHEKYNVVEENACKTLLNEKHEINLFTSLGTLLNDI